MDEKNTNTLTPQELEERAAALAQKEAQLDRREEQLKKGLLSNGDPDYVNPKEHLYDKLPFTVHQLDVFIGICMALIVLFVVLGVLHIDIFPHI